MASFGYIEAIISLIFLLFIFRLLGRNRKLPFNLPLVGMMPTVLLHFHRGHDKLTEILQQNDGTFVLKGPWFTNSDRLVTCDPANAIHVLSTNFSNYPKGRESKKVFDVMGDFLFNADHHEWESHRKMVRAFFSDPQCIRSTMNLVRDNIEKDLIPVLEHFSEKGLVMDLQDLFTRFMLDSTCSLVTGQNPGSLGVGFPEAPLAKALDAAADIVFHRFFLPKRLWMLQRRLGFGKEKKMTQAANIIDDIAGKYIRNKQEDIKGGVEGFDALKFFMTNDVGRVYKAQPYHILRDIVVLLISGGRDTSASTLSWFFWLISKNQLVVSKIREELKQNLPSHETKKFRLFSVDELNKLPYLHATFCETLRLYPPTYQVRIPVKTDILPSGHTVSPNSAVILSWYALGRMPSIWGSDCLEFKPERWISEKGEFKNELAKKLLFSFSTGPRVCPGKNDAFMRMKVVAGTIIHNYNVQVLEGHPVTPAMSVILCMNPGLMVKITKRWT